jgi:hypothetical protein
LKRGTPRHPKTLALAKAANISIPTAVGYLELLWHFTAEYAPRGDIGRYDVNYIEASILWKGPHGKLIEAMRETGWIDPPSAPPRGSEYGATTEEVLRIHDWGDHCDEATRKRLHRAGLSFVEVSEKVTGRRQTSRAREATPEPEPVAGPKPADAHTASAGPTNGACALLPADMFHPWYDGYPGRKSDPDGACRAWISVITAETVAAAFACRDRYAASDEVARGILMEAKKFIDVQARNKWRGVWPPAGTQKRPESASERKRREVVAGADAIEGVRSRGSR